MEIRRATMEDALTILEWRNDPATIAVSKTGPVSVSDHLGWFERTIDNPDRDLFMACEGNKSVGIVRFDHLSDFWLVSINIAPAERGKGYGDRALRKAMAEVGSRCFRAEIKPNNLASIRLFERCGFRQVGAEGGFLLFAWP